MELEKVDCSADPNPNIPIFRSPNPTSAIFDHQESSVLFRYVSLPVVTLPRPSSFNLPFATLSINSPELDYPPLSPTTLRLLAACSPSSPPHPSNPRLRRTYYARRPSHLHLGSTKSSCPSRSYPSLVSSPLQRHLPPPSHLVVLNPNHQGPAPCAESPGESGLCRPSTRPPDCTEIRQAED